jgi:hypothetical protein
MSALPATLAVCEELLAVSGSASRDGWANRYTVDARA